MYMYICITSLLVFAFPVPELHCWCRGQGDGMLEVGLTTTTGRRATWLSLFRRAKLPYLLHWMHVTLNARYIECTSRWMYVTLNTRHIECTSRWMYVMFNARHIECTWHYMYVTLNVRHIKYTWYLMHVTFDVRHIECTSHSMHVTLNARHIECTSHWIYVSLNVRNRIVTWEGKRKNTCAKWDEERRAPVQISLNWQRFC